MRFFIDKNQIADGRVLLSQEDSIHVARVLRKRAGDRLELCDGSGTDYAGIIEKVTSSSVLVEIAEEEPSKSEPTVHVTLYAGLSKGERFDLVIQKAVELGAAHIVPFTSRHCVVKLESSEYAKKRARMQKIALEACKQARRGKIVDVGEICSFERAIEQALKAQCPMLLYEKENKISLRHAMRDHAGDREFAVITGPEGGFSEEEAQMALRAGIPSLSVGSRILRCETAPLAALCAIMYETSNFDIGE